MADEIASILLKRYHSLETQRQTWESHWQEVADYVVPVVFALRWFTNKLLCLLVASAFCKFNKPTSLKLHSPKVHCSHDGLGASPVPSPCFAGRRGV